MALLKPDGTPDYSRGLPPFSQTRSWANDHARLVFSQEINDIAISGGSNPTPVTQAPVTNETSTSSPPDTGLSGTLPKFGSGGQVTIPEIRESNAGRTWGITVNPAVRSRGGAHSDSRLLEILKTALRELGYVAYLSSAAGAQGHVRGSRHARGQAIDIAGLYPHGSNRLVACHLDYPGSPNSSDAIRLAQWFIGHGFKAGGDGRPYGLIFGNGTYGWNHTGVDHKHHLHISIA